MREPEPQDTSKIFRIFSDTSSNDKITRESKEKSELPKINLFTFDGDLSK